VTSFRQIEANRRNALNSTGPSSPGGKERSRRNAVRHGLTAETVIGTLEDVEDYKAFEAAVIADYDLQSAVERELVLRLASLLWRLRRATTLETGLFEVQARQVEEASHTRVVRPEPSAHPKSDRTLICGREQQQERCSAAEGWSSTKSGLPAERFTADLTSCFLRLANLPTWPLDRRSRYEATLWRQAYRILFALDALNRRKPRERSPGYRPAHGGTISLSVA
jgi:hypothetical protein